MIRERLWLLEILVGALLLTACSLGVETTVSPPPAVTVTVMESAPEGVAPPLATKAKPGTMSWLRPRGKLSTFTCGAAAI